MENDQFLHDRPYHPQVFLVSLVLFPVDDRDGGFVRLYIVAGKDFLLEPLIQGAEQLHRFLEPSVQCAFRKAFHPKMPVLLYLTVERDMVIHTSEAVSRQVGWCRQCIWSTGISGMGRFLSPFCPSGGSWVLSLSAYLGRMISLT